MELARLAEELRHILPAPIVNITVNTQFRNFPSQVALPVWCSRISGIVKSMSLLMTNLNDQPFCKMPDTDLRTMFFQTSSNQTPDRGRREMIEDEIQQFGVSVRSLKSNFETQKPAGQQDQVVQCSAKTEPGNIGKQGKSLSLSSETDWNRDSGIDYDENTADVQETVSLRKERIVVLFLGHWKKSAYTVSVKSKHSAERKLSGENQTDPAKASEPEHRGSDMEDAAQSKMMNSSLGHFFRQRSAVNKLLGNWRKMISSVPSRQIRR